MQIILVSDSHGNNEALKKIGDLYPNADLFIHCGDSESDPISINPFVSCKGNCDYFGDFQNQLIIPSEAGTILVQHKPYIRHSDIEENDVKIIFHGHTHCKRFELIEGIYYINPGSISYPRDGDEPAFAIVTIKQKRVFVKFFTL